MSIVQPVEKKSTKLSFKKLLELWVGIKKNSRWTDALAEELHKPIARKFKKRRVYARRVDKIWAADLVDMSEILVDRLGRVLEIRMDSTAQD